MMRKLYKWLSHRALPLSFISLLMVVLRNWQLWQRDRAVLSEGNKLTPLPNLESWTQLPMVSVLVAAWNEEQRIKDHIQSFQALRYPNKELILCAGGGDGTHDIASRWAGPNVILLAQQPGEGKQRSLQHCLEKAKGEVIFLTDADCTLSDEAFERTIWPIAMEGEVVTTGTSRPICSQLDSSFVRHRWFTDVYVDSRYPDYVSGILGRNAALRRDVVDTIGEFRSEVKTGTDYHLALQVMQKGHSIRGVRQSVVETQYPDSIADYRRRQTRWLRNGVMHGLRFGDYLQALQCLIPSVGGLFLLLGPLAGLRLGRVAAILWLPAWAHVLLSRVRYMRFGELFTGHSFKLSGYLRLPVYAVVDIGIWIYALLQYPVKGWRTRW